IGDPDQCCEGEVGSPDPAQYRATYSLPGIAAEGFAFCVRHTLISWIPGETCVVFKERSSVAAFASAKGVSPSTLTIMTGDAASGSPVNSAEMKIVPPFT